MRGSKETVEHSVSNGVPMGTRAIVAGAGRRCAWVTEGPFTVMYRDVGRRHCEDSVAAR